MDANELHQALQKHLIVETTPRPPVFPAEKNHVLTTTSRPQTKEVRSRYKSPTPNAPTRPRRSPSPVPAVTRTAASNISVPKRAVSAERRRPSTPPQSSPSTPVQHTNVDALLASRKVAGNRLPESLWPSTTLRSLSASFQSDTTVSKIDKPANHATSDRTLKPSSNTSHKYNESPPTSRKSTPERKRSPLKGKNSAEQIENSRPVESAHSRLVEQHRWPSRAGGKISSSMSNRSIDLIDKASKIPSLQLSAKGGPSSRRLSLDGISNPSRKSATDLKSGIPRSVDDNSLQIDREMLSKLFQKTNIVSSVVRTQSLPTPGSRPAATSSSSSVESAHSRLVEQHRWPSRAGGKISSNMSNRSIDLIDKASKIPSLQLSAKGGPSSRRLSLDGISNPSRKSATDLKSGIPRSVDDNSLQIDREMLSKLFQKTNIVSSVVRTQSLPTPGSHPAATSSSSSVSRGVSPSKTKPGSSTTSSRGSSPARSRPSSPARQSNTTSVLSFMADIKKGMKAANHIEDVHQLRMLYNRQLQWQYANALADVSLHSQKQKTKTNIYSTWRATFDLRRSVIHKKIQLNQMMLKSKLCSVLNGQLSCLDEWASIETYHTESLFQAIKALQATTLRLPITAGAKGDVQTVNVAVSSAIDIVEAMGSSICSLMSQVEDTNSLVSEVANVAAQETAMLYECENLLESSLAMQAEECSLRSHLIQLKEAWKSERLVL